MVKKTSKTSKNVKDVDISTSKVGETTALAHVQQVNEILANNFIENKVFFDLFAFFFNLFCCYIFFFFKTLINVFNIYSYIYMMYIYI